MIEHKHLHDSAYHINLERRSEDLRHEKTPCPRLMRGYAETPVEILIERHHAATVEYGHQHESHYQLPYGEADDHLHVGERIDRHRPGHRNESDARHRGADHGQGRHIPRGAAVADEEARIVGSAPRNIGDRKEQSQVNQQGQQYRKRRHKKNFLPRKYNNSPQNNCSVE